MSSISGSPDHNLNPDANLFFELRQGSGGALSAEQWGTVRAIGFELIRARENIIELKANGTDFKEVYAPKSLNAQTHLFSLELPRNGLVLITKAGPITPLEGHEAEKIWLTNTGIRGITLSGSKLFCVRESNFLSRGFSIDLENGVKLDIHVAHPATGYGTYTFDLGSGLISHSLIPRTSGFVAAGQGLLKVQYLERAATQKDYEQLVMVRSDLITWARSEIERAAGSTGNDRSKT